MIIHDVELNAGEFELFKRSGALSIKHYSNEVRYGDQIMVHNQDIHTGPFEIRDETRGIYYGTDRNSVQILCCLSDLDKNEYEPYENTITGSPELDGLIKNCQLDERKGKYYILFEKDVSDATQKYSKMLTEIGISNSIIRKRHLYIENNEVCQRCIDRPLAYDERYLSGLFAPNMLSKKGNPGRDAPRDLEVARGLKNIPPELNIDSLPARVILYHMNASYLISAMSFRNHPCNEFIWGPDYIDDFQPQQKCCGSNDLAGYVASELMTEILSMSGYTIDIVWSKGDICYLTARRNDKLYDIILSPYIDDDLRECIDANPVPAESLLIPTHPGEVNMYIISLADVEKCEYDANIFDIHLQNLDINTLIPLVPQLIREMKIKMDMIWNT